VPLPVFLSVSARPSYPGLWPLISNPRGDFQGIGAYRFDVDLGQRKKVTLPPPFIVSMNPGYQGRLFGAAAFAFRGPRRSTILLGSELLQESRSVQGLPGIVVPTTITYAVRFVPAGALPLRGWGVEITEAHYRPRPGAGCRKRRARGEPPGTTSIRP